MIGKHLRERPPEKSVKLRPATTGVWWGPGASAGNACPGYWGRRGRPSSARTTWVPWDFRILTMLYLGFPLSPFFKIIVAEYIYDIKFATLTVFDDSVVLIHNYQATRASISETLPCPEQKPHSHQAVPPHSLSPAHRPLIGLSL